MTNFIFEKLLLNKTSVFFLFNECGREVTPGPGPDNGHN